MAAATGALHLLAAASTDVGLFGAHAPTRPWRAGEAPEPGTLRLLHATSHDAGATWAWTDLTDLCLPGSVLPHGCVLFPASGHGTALTCGPAAGRLIAPLVAALPTAPQDVLMRSLCLLSDDDGATWRLGEPVPVAAGAGRSLAGGARTAGTDEHAVAVLDGATVLMSARDGSYGGTRLTSLSQDGATTWSPAQRDEDVPDPGCNAGLVALDGGRALLSHAADPAGRRAGRLSLRTARGHWRVLHELGEGPFGYSDLALLPDADALVVWEAPGPDGSGALHLRRVPLARVRTRPGRVVGG
ncbi:exo-alpha-sialidase [Actinomyces sp. 186855]|nr:sialidase family protein [Actinomyces sp. AC-20-1]MCL3791952.1 exo-alpha-sialidase [Actinomyces sp. 186855]